MTERFESRARRMLRSASRAVGSGASAVARLSTATDDGYLMHLGASCMRIAAENALQSHDARQTLRSWRECIAGRSADQARDVSARCARGAIGNGHYDDIFALAREASRLREHERQRLRRELRRSSSFDPSEGETMKTKERFKAVQAAIAAIEKQFGKGAIMPLDGDRDRRTSR